MSEADWKEAWSLFDEKKTDQVSKADFAHLIRALGRKHTEAEIAEITGAFGEAVTYAQFFEHMKKPYRGPTTDDLRASLQSFDGCGSGYLKAAEIVILLTTLGEKMPADEVAAMMREAEVDCEGRVAIDDFVEVRSGYDCILWGVLRSCPPFSTKYLCDDVCAWYGGTRVFGVITSTSSCYIHVSIWNHPSGPRRPMLTLFAPIRPVANRHFTPERRRLSSCRHQLLLMRSLNIRTLRW